MAIFRYEASDMKREGLILIFHVGYTLCSQFHQCLTVRVKGIKLTWPIPPFSGKITLLPTHKIFKATDSK